MREPANKSLLTDVSGFCFHLCTIISTHTSLEISGENIYHVSPLDLGHNLGAKLKRNQYFTLSRCFLLGALTTWQSSSFFATLGILTSRNRP
jgi:hypothetical protein